MRNKIDNILRKFHEGIDYTVQENNGELIYRFHSDWLRNLFGENEIKEIIYEIAEQQDSEKDTTGQGKGKFINRKGQEITYTYGYYFNHSSGDYFHEHIEWNSNSTNSFPEPPRLNEKESNLAQENQQLKKQLAEVQKQLTQTLSELKKLRGDEWLIHDLEAAQASQPDADKKAQAAQHWADMSRQSLDQAQNYLVEATQSTFSGSNDKHIGYAPYLIGGFSLLLGGGLITLLITKKRKIVNKK